MPYATAPLPAFITAAPHADPLEAWGTQAPRGRDAWGLSDRWKRVEGSSCSTHARMSWSLAALCETPAAGSSSSSRKRSAAVGNSSSRVGTSTAGSRSSKEVSSKGGSSSSNGSSGSFVPCVLVGDLFVTCNTLHAFKTHTDLDQLLGGSNQPSNQRTSRSFITDGVPATSSQQSTSTRRPPAPSAGISSSAGKGSTSTPPDIDAPVQLLLRMTQAIEGRRLFFVSRDAADVIRQALVLDRFNELMRTRAEAAGTPPTSGPDALAAWGRSLSSWLQPKPNRTPPLLPTPTPPPATATAPAGGSPASKSSSMSGPGSVQVGDGGAGRSGVGGAGIRAAPPGMGGIPVLMAHELSRLEEEAVTAEAKAIKAQLAGQGSGGSGRGASGGSSSSGPSASFVGRMPLEAAYKLLAAAPSAFDVVCTGSDARAVRQGKGRRALLDCRESAARLSADSHWVLHVERGVAEQEAGSENDDTDTSDDEDMALHTTRTPVFVVPGLRVSVRTAAGTTMELSPTFLSLAGVQEVVSGAHAVATRAWLAGRAARRERLRKRVEGFALALTGMDRGMGGAPAAAPRSGGEEEEDDEEGYADPPEAKALLAELGEGKPAGGGGGAGAGMAGPPPGPVAMALTSAALGVISLAGHAVSAAGDVVDNVLVASPLGPGLVGLPKHLAIQATHLEDLLSDMATANATKIKAGALAGIVAARPPAPSSSPRAPSPSPSASVASLPPKAQAKATHASASSGVGGSGGSSRASEGTTGLSAGRPSTGTDTHSAQSGDAHPAAAGIGSHASSPGVEGRAATTPTHASTSTATAHPSLPNTDTHGAVGNIDGTAADTATTVASTASPSRGGQARHTSSSMSTADFKPPLPTVGELRAAERGECLDSLKGLSVLMQAAWALVHASKAGDGQMAAWLGRGPWTGQAKLSKDGDGELSVVMDITLRAIAPEVVQGLGSSAVRQPPPAGNKPGSSEQAGSADAAGSPAGSDAGSSGNGGSAAGSGGAGPAGRVVSGTGVRVQDVAGGMRLTTPVLTPAKPQRFQVGLHINTNTLLGGQVSDTDAIDAIPPSPLFPSASPPALPSAPTSSGSSSSSMGSTSNTNQALQQGTQLILPPGAGTGKATVLQGLLLVGDVGLGAHDDEELPWRTPPLGAMDMAPLVGIMAARQAAHAAKQLGGGRPGSKS